ncbi:MAG: hypothetical protein JO113_06950 [Candidatus Eremiobacteraeota bacterium]|nr:hypothetical protein [Candidatus Eremiobacteraeota bacterium]
MLTRLTYAILALTFAAAPALGAMPAPKATLPPTPQGTEVAFVASIQKDLMARFPTAADAVKAGYFRYTNEDSTGAISYANLHWQSGSPQEPSQLWYDVNGNLLGADFSVLQSTSPAPPKLWGVDYRRWVSFREHVHYILVGPNGTEIYGATRAKKFAAAGGNVDDPQAATLVKMGKAKSVAEVKRVFLFPSLWDLIVWVKTNPNGAFAEKNPLVIPSANAEKDDM